MFDLSEIAHGDMTSVAEDVSPGALLAMVLYTQATPQMTSWLWGIWDQLPAFTLLPGADAQLSEPPGDVPVGSVIMLADEIVPVGYLEADGRALGKTNYPELHAALGERYTLSPDGPHVFRIPDLRGVFPRFWDHGRGIDVDSSGRLDSGNGTTGDHVGTRQNFAITQHSHTISPIVRSKHPNLDTNTGTNPILPYGISNYRDTFALGGVTGAAASTENYPTNINLLPLIKALYPADPRLESLMRLTEALEGNLSQLLLESQQVSVENNEATPHTQLTQTLALTGTILGASVSIASVGMFALARRYSRGRAALQPPTASRDDVDGIVPAAGI